MNCHFELEQVGPFLTLDDFVVEFGIDKWSIDTIAWATAIWLIIWCKQSVEMILGDFRSTVLESASLGFDHQND